MANRTGGCLCGAVRYELTAEPFAHVACHCRDCQYASGGAPTLAMLVPRPAINITKGEVRTYWCDGDSGGKVGRSFCEACGTPIFSEPASSGPIAVIKVGSLDDASDFSPQVYIWTKSAKPWHHIPEGVARFEGQPG
ncbi:MAG TPA: GFA family protein [Caulobacteraceae bacterium]|nr:GFA family protein [Caulobacteraceae bacterium]